MSKFKRRISLMLSVMMLSLTILPLFVVNAADEISYTVKLNGSAMSTSKTYEVEAGDTIVFTASSSTVDVGLVGYYFDGNSGNIKSSNSNKITITVPDGEAGSTTELNVAASGYDADKKVVQGAWSTYTLKYTEEATTVDNKDLVLKYGSKTLSANSTTTVDAESNLTFSAKPSDEVVALYYAWGTEDFREADGSSATIKVPSTFEAGSAHNLYVTAKYSDGEYAEGEKYIIKIAQATSDVTMVVKMDGVTMKSGNTYNVEGGEKIVATADCLQGIAFIGYYYSDNSKIVDVYDDTLTITVPTKADGTKITLYIEAVATDDDGEDNPVKTGWVPFVLQYPEPDPEVANKDVSLKYGSKTLAVDSTTEVKVGEFLTASATPSAEVVELYYAWGTEDWRVFYKATGSIEVPETLEVGKSYNLYITAKYSDGKYANRERYIIKIVEDEVVVSGKAINVSYENKVLSVNSTTTVNPGESVKITATPSANVTKIYFKWDNDSWAVANGVSSYSTRIPTTFAAGSTHTLYVKAAYDDGKEISQQKYIFKIPVSAADITMNVKVDSRTMTAGKTYEVEGGEEVVVTASVTNTSVDYIKYKFGSDSYQYTYSKTARFDVPVEKVGTTLKLYVEAVSIDGQTTGVKTYNLKFVETSDGTLDIEPWMEENDELVELAVNLRNDSEVEDKANKNIYELNETITYFVDYKNGTGDDVETEVGLVLELPLAFTVVDADGGKVDTKKKTITWEFPNGLEEDESGTKVVKVKYTALTKSKYDAETVYPSAIITKGSKAKEQDRSTVINLVIIGYAEEIDIEHEPYMFGDENENTFRPDDSISRAEGALVLARIYGLNYKSTKVTNVFSDLGDTYVEAQKAIIAATKAGLISGYTDGTFRPNAKMTRAEFMKILACMVEKQAAEDEIEGLEVKDLENSIKVYDDSTRYYIVDGKKIYSHWALEEVTLLARLNMTPLSEENDEIELDEEITRAEVAQLVNFYLLRAPANVTSKTKSGFDDVSKKHDLFADIIEATRDSHTFSMEEEDGTETAE